MKRWWWTEYEVKELRRAYPDQQTCLLAERFGCTVPQLYGLARRQGWKKSAAYIARYGRHLDGVIGQEHRFQKGHVPANKGKPHPSRGRSRETQFKKGKKPSTWLPIGSERFVDGYLYRKVSDCHPPGMSRFDWRLVHILNWEQAHGPVPPQHAVRFIDGDRTHVELANLELIHRRELMRRNTIHNLPPALVGAITARAALIRRINRKERQQ